MIYIYICVHQRYLYSRNQKKLEKTITRKQKQTKKAPAKQRATKKAKIMQPKVQPKKHKQNKEQPRKQKQQQKKSNQKRTSKTQRVVWRGRVGLVVDKGLFWCRAKRRTFGRFLSLFSPGPSKKSHSWSLFFPQTCKNKAKKEQKNSD